VIKQAKLDKTSVTSSNLPQPPIEDPSISNKIADPSESPEPVAKHEEPIVVPVDITSDQIAQLKSETVEYAKEYSKKGTSTRKEPSPDLANDQGPYLWWENQDSYEGNTWSVSYWEYDNKYWQLQATKVEVESDGKSIMTAYSMRKDSDVNFPGFQVYKEKSDDRYHPAEIEDVVYLNRVLKALRDSKQ